MNMTKVVMPSVTPAKVPSHLNSCMPTLAKDNSDGTVHTVIRGRGDTVLFIDENGIMQGTLEYFERAFTIIREYEKGETLSITV